MSERKEQPAGAKMDLRIRRTRSAIREAFVALMKEKDYAAITVTDISEMAGINRKTFYAHYETKEQLFSRLMEEMFSDLLGTLMYEKTAGQDLAVDLTAFFEKIDGYREAIDALITPQTSAFAFSIADDVIRRGLKIARMPQALTAPIHHEIYVSRITNSFFTGLDWRQEQPELTPAQAARVYESMMRTCLASVFGYQ